MPLRILFVGQQGLLMPEGLAVTILNNSAKGNDRNAQEDNIYVNQESCGWVDFIGICHRILGLIQEVRLSAAFQILDMCQNLNAQKNFEKHANWDDDKFINQDLHMALNIKNKNLD